MLKRCRLARLTLLLVRATRSFKVLARVLHPTVSVRYAVRCATIGR